jgi:hypothetical protein
VPEHIWYIQGYPDGTIQPDGSVTRAEIAMMLFRLLADDNKNNPQASTFADVQPGKWYTQAVAYLAKLGILTGYENGTFNPNAPITRAEIAVILSRFTNFNGGASSASQFSDTAGHWAKNYIDYAAANGWVQGYADGSFKPDAYLSRAETATIINRILARDDGLENPPTFPDLPTTHWGYQDLMETVKDHDHGTGSEAAGTAETEATEAEDEE